MEYSLWALVTAVLFVSGSVQVFMALELRRMRLKLSEPAGGELVAHTSHHDAHLDGIRGSRHGYAIYVYRRGRWEVEADLSAPGFEPSMPGLKGAYEGQVLKKESAPASGR